MRLSTIVSGALLALLISATMSAAPVTYVYTGPNFDTFYGSPVAGPGDHITAIVTFSGPLLANSIHRDPDFSISDGHITLSSATAKVWDSYFRTDASAQILFWFLDASEMNPPFVPYLVTSYVGGNSNFSWLDISLNPVGCDASTSGETPGGVWELQQTGVPEPGTLSLLFAGCVCVALIRRRASIRS